MNTNEQTQLDQLEAQIAVRTRAMFDAARQLGLPIGHLTPEEAIHQIIATGYGPLVVNTARHLFPEAFNESETA